MKVSGRTTVGKFKELFKEEFGTSVRVYQGRKFADNSSTLASIRKDDAKIKGNVEIRGNMKVGNVEKLFLNEYGIVIKCPRCYAQHSIVKRVLIVLCNG